MRAIHPSPLLQEAAEALGPVKDDVVVIGAAAIDVALHAVPAAITPTRDVDVVVGTDEVDRIVRHLEDVSLAASEDPYERGFTWVRGDLKVQLIRGFHPFPTEAGRKLPVNPTAELARDDAHRELIAFEDEPGVPRLWVATAACLIALKQHAFGRKRPPGDEVVRRDFHDVYSLIANAPDAVIETYGRANGHVRERVRVAVRGLGTAGEEPVRLAGAEMVDLEEAENQRNAEAEILRLARTFQGRL